MSIKTISIIIAEDEIHNRTFLRSILEKHEDFKLVGEAANGRELINLAAKTRPQVAFVDIEMPELDGMSAVKKLLETNEDLLVVFVTGHPGFAVEAFEVCSFDYILKPFKPDRVERTLEKIRQRLTEQEKDIQKLSNLFKSTDKLFIRCGHELQFIDVNSIYFIEKGGKKTVIHTSSHKYETKEAINDLESRLDSMCFFRSHRCYLINLKNIQRIQPWGDNSYLVKFPNCSSEAMISRSKVKILYDLLDVNAG